MTRHSHAAAWLELHGPELRAHSLELERAKGTERQKRYAKARWGDDPEWRRMLAFRGRFTSCLARKWAGGKAPTRETDTCLKLFGCSWTEFRAHVEAQFQPGMTWENYGRGSEKWCLDHRRAICLFDWWTWEGLKEAFHWNNVQPLWGWQHRAKNDHDNTLGRRRRMTDTALQRRLKPQYAPPIEGTDAQIMAALAAQLQPV